MKFRTLIVILYGALAFCEAVAFAGPGAYIPSPQDKKEKVSVEFITPQELKAKIASNEPVLVVDLRGPSVYAQSDKTIKGSLHTKVRKVVYRLRLIPREREVITYCACPADEAALIGARALLANGFKKVRVLKGGWNAWLEGGGQVQSKPRT
jgi:rhodanese-related sulfurtransferase